MRSPSNAKRERMARKASRSKNMRASFGSRTDVGMVRQQNEDSLVVAPPLYVVCDGMGGHEAGEIASEIAVNVISRRKPPYPDAPALGQAVEEANLAILHAASEGVGREGMGTTCTAAMLAGERLVIAQVGDSRAYLLHNGHLQQITRDHSYVADLVERGAITPEEARHHAKRSVITRALGSDPRMQADLYEVNVTEGDRLLLCSDGLYSMVLDQYIEEILNEFADPQVAAEELVEDALAAGGTDNVTVIVADVTGFADVKNRKVARKTKVTAAIIVFLLAALVTAAVFAFSWWTTNSAYLGEVDGRVAVYQGVPGSVFGAEFNDLKNVTDVELKDLQPGLQNRIREHMIRCDSLDAAYELVTDYKKEVDDRKKVEENGSSNSSSSSNASNSSSSSANSNSSAGSTNNNQSGGR